LDATTGATRKSLVTVAKGLGLVATLALVAEVHHRKEDG
jgi:hypothetical protein